MKRVLKWVLCVYCTYCLSLHASVRQKSINYSSGLGSPITTSTADTLEKGKIGFSQRLEYYPSYPLSNNVLLENPIAQSQLASSANYLMMFYGLEDKITIGANLPYFASSSISAATFNTKTNSAYITNLGSPGGLGDASFFSVWRLVEENKHFASLAVLSGINVPTGKINARDSNGFLFSAADQPGNGAWIPFTGIIISKQMNRFSLNTNLIYTQGTEGTQQTTSGSVFVYNFASVYEFYNNEHMKLQIDGILELNGEYITKDNIAGLVDQNSGGNSIFLLPGLRVNKNPALSCYFGINIPLVERYNGIQVKNKYGITAGIDINI